MIVPVFIPHLGCPNQCVFCNQRTITGLGEQRITVQSAREEIEAWLERSKPGTSHELAFYGGSFTALPEKLQRSFLELAESFIKQGRIHSLRVSTRPDAIDRERLRLLKAFGVSHIELGAQSFDDRVLSMSQRGHRACDIEHACESLHQEGIKIGLQLMVGLPGDSDRTDIKGIEEAFRLGATTLRIYPTLVLRGTPLENMLLCGSYAPLSLEEAVARVARMLDVIDEKNALASNTRLELIRVGLQENEMLSTSGEVLAGPHHPAFRSLVDTYRFKTRIDQEEDRVLWRGKHLEVRVRSRDLSNFAGYKRSNLIGLQTHYGVLSCKLICDNTIPAMQYVISIADMNGR